MKKILVLLITTLCCQLIHAQCTPAAIRATAPLNTPAYPLNTAFNANATANAVINNLSNGLVNFNGTVSGTARWVDGVQIQNDVTVGNYIYVQPNNTDNASSATNVATYTFDFAEPVYNLSFRAGGLNNVDQIRVTAFNGAIPIAITAANFSNIVNFNPSGTINISGNILTGNNSGGGFDVLSNRVTTTIAGPVTRVILYTGKADNGNGTVTLGFNSFAYTRCVSVPPDVNATFVNTAVTGDVGTNDIKPTGTTYGNATAQPGNPGPAVPTINTDGTYSFTSAVVGVFTFLVPMCPPGVASPDCPLVPLIITVTQPTVNTNNPIANIDRATTPVNTAVTLNTLANDKDGNNSPVILNPASVTVTTAPLHGTTSVNPATGNITYTPNSGYTGYDTLKYQVCDLASPTPRCAISLQIITIEPAASGNTTVATDDYNSTPLNTPITNGNVKTNDSDPQGNTQTVTAQNTTIAGKGTLILNTNGTYTFTPVTGYTGPVNFTYQTCDNGTPSVCANATLYILIFPLGVLPLDIVSFTSTINANNTNLFWVSANQININRFEIERSPVNPVSFTTVGTVPVNNSSSGSYSFVDVNAKFYIAKGYYRLKIIDNDGRITYSQIVLVNFGNDFAITIRPTILTAGQPVTILTGTANTGKKYTGVLYNQAGQVIQTWEALVGSFNQIETGKLSSGLYLIKIITADGIKTEKIIVQ